MNQDTISAAILDYINGAIDYRIIQHVLYTKPLSFWDTWRFIEDLTTFQLPFETLCKKYNLHYKYFTRATNSVDRMIGQRASEKAEAVRDAIYLHSIRGTFKHLFYPSEKLIIGDF